MEIYIKLTVILFMSFMAIIASAVASKFWTLVITDYLKRFGIGKTLTEFIFVITTILVGAILGGAFVILTNSILSLIWG